MQFLLTEDEYNALDDEKLELNNTIFDLCQTILEISGRECVKHDASIICGNCIVFDRCPRAETF